MCPLLGIVVIKCGQQRRRKSQPMVGDQVGLVGKSVLGIHFVSGPRQPWKSPYIDDNFDENVSHLNYHWLMACWPPSGHIQPTLRGLALCVRKEAVLVDPATIKYHLAMAAVPHCSDYK